MSRLLSALLVVIGIIILSSGLYGPDVQELLQLGTGSFLISFGIVSLLIRGF